jgi:hypothetical protein
MSDKNKKNILPKIKSHNKNQKQTRNQNNKNNANNLPITSLNKNTKGSENFILKNLSQITSAKIIDETINDSKRIEVIKKKVYKIIFVYRNEDFYITVQLKTLIKNMRKAICQLIGINSSKISLVYQDIEIDESYDEKTVDEYFDLKNIKYRPIVYIKRRFKVEGESSMFNMIPKNYNYKVKIQNFPINIDTNIQINENIDNIVNSFFKSYYSIKNNNNNLENIHHYKIENIIYDKIHEEEKEEENKALTENKNPSYFVCFSSQDIAFDFNRYMNAKKIVNPIFKDTKISLVQIPKKIVKIKNKSNSLRTTIKYGVDYGLEEDDNLKKRNTKILKLIRINFLKKEKLGKFRKNQSQSNITAIGPYLSQLDKDRMALRENKKKWLSPEGFISCVGKYSGIQI